MNRRLFACFFAGLWLSTCSLALHAQDVRTLKFQSNYPASLVFFQQLPMFAERVERMTGGKVKIEALPAGAIVPPLEVLDAVNRKVLDGGHNYAGFALGKHRAAALFGGSPAGPFGMDMHDYLAWLYEGGGWELYTEFYRDVLKMNVVPLPISAGPPTSLGWFKKPIKTWEDLKGLKMRMSGIPGEVFKEAGVSIIGLPPGEILPAGERGLIDAAEFLGGADDVTLGFAKVWKYQHAPSFHEYTFTTDILINGDVWASLSNEVKEIMRSAALESSVRFMARKVRADALSTQEVRQKQGVQIVRTPDAVLRKFIETWDKVTAREAEKNPFFKKVLDSQRNFASLVVPHRVSMWPNYDFAAEHYWKDKIHNRAARRPQ